MPHTVRDLAALVGGHASGDLDHLIASAHPVADAAAGDITFLDHDKYLDALRSSPASAVVVPPRFAGQSHAAAEIVADDPFAAFVAIATALHSRPPLPVHGIDPHSAVDPSATLGPDASVHAFAAVGANATIGARVRLHPGAVVGRDCVLGDDVTLHANAVLYDGTVVGNRVTVHANSVVGADGFGYRFQAGRHQKVPQLGHVELGDDVEVGACSTIDRGTFKPTRVGAGTKIDNHVMIAHNCQIGRHNVIVSQVGIAGSSSTGDYVVVAGQAGIVDHVHVGDRSVIGGRAGVVNDVPPDSKLLGSPAINEREQKRLFAVIAKLPELRKELKELMARVGGIERLLSLAKAG